MDRPRRIDESRRATERARWLTRELLQLDYEALERAVADLARRFPDAAEEVLSRSRHPAAGGGHLRLRSAGEVTPVVQLPTQRT